MENSSHLECLFISYDDSLLLRDVIYIFIFMLVEREQQSNLTEKIQSLDSLNRAKFLIYYALFDIDKMNI